MKTIRKKVRDQLGLGPRFAFGVLWLNYKTLREEFR